MVDTSNLLPATPRLLKVPLIILNIVLWILGLVLVIVGGVAVSFFSNFKDFSNAASTKSALANLTSSIPAGVLVIGIIFILITVAGCFVAYKEKLVGLVVYSVIMLILLVILIGVAGKALTLHNDDVVMEIGNQWFGVSNGTKSATITKLEKFLKCCRWNTTDPYSDLCPTEKGADSQPNVLYPDTFCGDKLTNQMESKLYAVGAAGLAIGIIELIAMLFAVFLIVRICRSPKTRQYDAY